MQGIHVFFATDGSESARFAQEHILAMPWRRPLHVTVMTALSFPNPRFTSWIPGVREAFHSALTRLRDEAKAGAEEAQEKARRALDGKVAGLSLRTHEGLPGFKIVEMAAACRADLVAVGSQGTGAHKGLFPGSVADYVLNHSRTPVLMAKTAPPGNRRYLFALDGSPHSAAAVRWLEELDLPEGTRVHLVRVFPTIKALKAFRSVRETAAPAGGEGADRKIPAGKFILWADSPDMLQALSAQRFDSRGVRVTAEARFGQEGPELVESVRKFDPDLLILGAGGRGSRSDRSMGAVARSLVEQAPCSVLVVRPSARPFSMSRPPANN